MLPLDITDVDPGEFITERVYNRRFCSIRSR